MSKRFTALFFAMYEKIHGSVADIVHSRTLVKAKTSPICVYASDSRE